MIDPVQVADRRGEAQGTIGYLAGGCENETEVWHLFHAVAYLVAPDEVLRDRLTTRTTNDYGKSEEELAVILGWNAVLEPNYRANGATIIDASRPLAEVVADVCHFGRSVAI